MIMRPIDVILALIFGRILGFLVGDFLGEWGIKSGFYYLVLVWVILPLVTLLCLWIAHLIGKKVLFLFQVAKFLLVGAIATVVDLKLFEFFAWIHHRP